jgi:hypothetical protein
MVFILLMTFIEELVPQVIILTITIEFFTQS